jgi:glycosyltransferase involved in cell wall biosynthesis
MLSAICAANHYGGGEAYASEIMKFLVGRGWKVTLIAGPQSPFIHDKELMDSVGFEPLDLSVKISRPGAFLRTLGALRKILALQREGILYANGFEALKFSGFGRMCFGFNDLCHLHLTTPRAYTSFQARFFGRRVEKLIAVSQEMKECFCQLTGVPLEKVEVIRNGSPINPDPEKHGPERERVFQELGIPANARVVAMAGRMDPMKGHEFLLRAIPGIVARLPDAHFLIVGFQGRSTEEKVYYGEMTRLIAELGVAPHVTTVGYSQEVSKFFRVADLAVLPSIHEGFPRVAVEAMAERTPLVAAPVGGVGELVRDRENGRLFPARDVPALAAILSELLLDPAERERLARNGYQTVKDGFSFQSMADQVEAQLLKLLPQA